MFRAPQMALLLMLTLFASCGSVPTDSTDGNGITDNGTYINEDWGFRVSAPDSTWGVQVQVFELSPAPNGIPLLEMWFLSPSISTSAEFRPVMYLAPDALSTDKTLNELVVDIETELSQIFENYSPASKQTVLIGAENGAKWEFQATASDFNFIPGTRFWVTVVLHGREVYLMIGSGISNLFPTADYQRIASSLVLTD